MAVLVIRGRLIVLTLILSLVLREEFSGLFRKLYVESCLINALNILGC